MLTGALLACFVGTARHCCIDYEHYLVKQLQPMQMRFFSLWGTALQR